jgi:signal transduction histidine kinase
MEARIKEKEVVVAKHYARKLPRIMVDRGKMEQVIINILLNSIEVLPKGGCLEIFTQQRRKEGSALFCEISDEGPGISPDDFPYVFDPFFSNKKKGTGLGLSNVKKIIEAHGGTVKLALRKPQGTRVGLTLPLRRL